MFSVQACYYDGTTIRIKMKILDRRIKKERERKRKESRAICKAFMVSVCGFERAGLILISLKRKRSMAFYRLSNLHTLGARV